MNSVRQNNLSLKYQSFHDKVTKIYGLKNMRQKLDSFAIEHATIIFLDTLWENIDIPVKMIKNVVGLDLSIKFKCASDINK